MFLGCRLASAHVRRHCLEDWMAALTMGYSFGERVGIGIGNEGS